MSVLNEITYTNFDDTRAIVDEVVKEAFNSVCSTMGPDGRYVVINQTNRPKVTKDGVSVAKALDFNEARRNLIAKIITEPSIKTDVEVGDGTTTTIFQMHSFYEAFKDKMSFKNVRYLDSLIEEVVRFIGGLIIPCDVNTKEFERMLLTSSNYEEEIVNKILEIYKGYQNPNITLTRRPALKEDNIVKTTDIHFDGQYGADGYAPQDGRAFTFKAGHVTVLLIDSMVNSFREHVQSLITNTNINCPTIIVARGFDMNVLNLINSLNSNLNRAAIIPFKLHAAGSLGTSVFNDLATLLNTRVLHSIDAVESNVMKLADVNVTLKVKGISLDKADPNVEERADHLLKGMDVRYNEMTIVDRQQVIGRELFRRISRLRANNIIIEVTGVTESDATERYYRYEDVMKAANTGLQYGVLPGIGYAYMEAAKHVLGLPKQSDEELDELRKTLAQILTYQYSHLTGIYATDEDQFGKYVDLVTGEISDIPTTVFDNAAATMIALRGAWQTAKTLSKTNNIMGRSNQSYT